ncbi:hypothetical protein [Amycolatopsis thermoflava]|uniref:hypothetical protein n=1 Tax=Amycolatopsis thermoflava TaxID=84480 RepID=UPI003D717585
MEIIDAGLMGVRSAVLRVSRRQTPLRFTIYPMVHLGERSFYDEVSRRLRDHDLIVAEGIIGASAGARKLTRTYRHAGGHHKLGLVEQSKSMVDVGVPVVWADLTGSEFDDGWRKVPFTERAIATVGAPLVAGYLRMFGSPEVLARHLKLDDDIAIDRWDPDSGLDRLVSDEREARLVRALQDIHERRHDERIDVAVVYGAAHALPVVQFLMAKLGYVVSSADWVTVFTY